MSFFVHRRIVEFHETDAAGLVHFTNYFRWAEAAEHALFREIEYPMMRSENGGHFGWPRVRAQSKYSAPLRMGEGVLVKLAVVEVKDKAIDYQFRIERERDGELAAKGTFSVVHVIIDDATGEMKGEPIPAELIKKLQPYGQE